MPVAPDTSEELVPLAVGDVTVYLCRRTGGIWFPEEALAAIKSAGPSGLQSLDDQSRPTQPVQVDPSKPHKCPIDGSSLLHYHYQDRYDVTLEQCMECGGMWVPHTELDKLVSIHPDPEAERTFKPHHVDYPLDANGDYDDSPQSAKPPANVSTQAIQAASLMSLGQQQTAERLSAFTTFLNVANWDPFRDYVGRRGFWPWQW